VHPTQLVSIAVAAFVLELLVPSAAEERSVLRDACVRTSNAETCDKAGDLIERGDLRSRYPEEAGLYFALACERGVARSCRRAQPWAKRYSDYESFETDVGCMLRRNGFACEEVANALRDERDDDRAMAEKLALARSRMQRALRLYLDGCARHDAESCLGASRVHSAGFGVPWSPRDALARESDACELGLPAACERAGDRRTAADALPLYRRACELSPCSPHACLKLARAYESTGTQEATIAASYRRACEVLAFDACAWVAGHVESLDGESPGVVEAFRRWCSSGSPRACALANRPAR
jgi:TPR repeat protein